MSEEDANEKFLTKGLVAQRYNATTRTIDRYAKNEKSGFPKPTYLADRPYWRLSDLVKWERSCSGQEAA